MNDPVIIVLLISIPVIGLVTLCLYVYIKSREGKSELKAELKRKGDFLYSVYCLALKLPPLKKYMNRIRRRIETLDLSDDWTISRKTARFTIFSLGITLSVFIFLLFFSRNFYFLVISVFSAYMLHNQVIKMLVEKLENKLLRQFEVFLGNVRHHYHEHGMIDEAIYDSIEDCDYEISLHANRMYEVLTSADIDEAIEQYNDTAPNKFMKTFIAMCCLVQRFGDKVADNKSVYLNNLNYLKQEINMELLRREKLGYLFRSLSVISVFPVFTLRPLEKWAVSNIPELKEYYDGTYGFIAVIVLFLLSFGAYQLIGRLQINAVYTPTDGTLFALLLKIPALRAFIESIIDKNHSRAVKYDRLLKKAGAKTSVNEFLVKRLIYAILTLILAVGICINIHSIARHNILYSSASLRMAEYDPQINTEAELKIIESDRKYILRFKGKKVNFQDVDRLLREQGEYDNERQSGIAAKRIIDKLNLYNSHNFKWWELFIAMVLSVAAWYVPYLMLLFRERVLRMNMEDEVMQFHTIILMLMHIERIHVEDILTWMEQFADIFKSSISKCINNYEYGDRKALEQLALDEPYPPFVRIVENLQTAADKITIEHAFDELKTEREYYMEKRKQDNEIMVNKKGAWGRFIAFIPMGATVFFYLLVPFVLVSATQLTGFSEEISKVF